MKDWLDEPADWKIGLAILSYLDRRDVIRCFGNMRSGPVAWTSGKMLLRMEHAARRGTWRSFLAAIANNFMNVASCKEFEEQLANLIYNGEQDFETDDLETAVLYARLGAYFGWGKQDD